MSNPICYLPQTGVDDVIAANVAGWNPSTVALLRGIYDENHSSPLDTSDPKQAATTLAQYRKELAENNAKSIRTQSTNLASAFENLKKSFSAEERFNRVNMIATMFSGTLDRLQRANKGLSRKLLCNGFKANGRQVAGEMAIYESVFDQLLARRNWFLSKGLQAEAEKINKVLDNWGALVSLSRMKLRDTEGLKLGHKLEYADEANLDNFGDNDIAALYSAEESTREHWQETNDMQSSFGSASTEVRRFLGTLQDVDENGKYVSDDLGFPRMMDAVKTHQALMEKLRGVTSQAQMLGILRNAAQQEPWLKPILAGLEDRRNPQTGADDTNYLLRTQFFVDFKKNFQPYSILVEKIEDGVRTFKTKVLNRVENLLSGKYMTRVALGKPVNANTSIFDSKGNINWANLQKIRATVKEYFPDASKSIVQKFFDNKQTSYVEKKKIIKNLTQALGIDIDDNTVAKLVSNSKAIHGLAKQLNELVTWGIEGNLDNSTLDALDKGQFSSLPVQSFKELLKRQRKNSNSKDGDLKEKIDKILQIVSENREGLRLESRGRWKDAKGNNITLFSNVNPSFLGDFIGKIHSFAEYGDKNGLRNFLTSQYLDSSMFIDAKGNILNKWIEDLINSGMNDRDFAAMFQYKRFMGHTVNGGNENNFENFTSKQHAISMMNEYFSEKQQHPKENYAWYPVFILGDSGVSKYIRAKRYTSQEILDGMYNVYRSERRRMEQAKAANEKLANEGYSLIDNFSKNADKYTMLSFLNADHTTSKYYDMIKDNPSEQNVKAAIKAYMDDATANFKQNLQSLGLLGTTEQYNPATQKMETKYEYFSQEVTGGKTIDNVIADFYWNTKFATTQQLQMMTIDPAFYKGTKDLQKRYKEIHAPGSSIDIDARNPWSSEHELFNPKDEQGRPQPERCVYFEDIELNAEDYDPKFMQAIESHFDKDSDIYKAYKKNTLTDGQGYRTLESYRKVMGMSGKWTQQMENAYKEIQSLRAKYGKEDIPMDDLTRIGELAVVFQPIKPYMYTIENYALNDNDVLKIPVQHKYAEAVIIPELLPKGSKLRDTAYWMEEHKDDNGRNAPIDLIGSTKIVKVGGFGSATIKGMDTVDKLNDALDKGYVHQLNYGDYRIQTNVPEHINSSQLFGTQVRKLIMAGLNKKAYYDSYVGGNKVNLGGIYKDVELTGRNLNAFYNSLIVANIIDSYKDFEKDMSDPKTVSDMLIQATINNSRESIDNLTAFGMDNGEFAIPLFEGGLEHDSAALLFSIFKKRVNKQSIKGGSAVQVSAMGIEGYTEDGDLHYITDKANPNNILYAEAEIPFDLSATDAQGNEVELKFEDWCNADGTLKLDTSKELDITKRENRLYQSYYITDAKGTKHYYKPLIEQTYPGILSILAYRIPTERDYSMINIRVKKFSQKTAGGTIKVPAQGTTIAGFDFDIDKLYFMRNEYKARELSPDEIADIWEAIYKANPDVKRALKDIKSSSEEAQELVTDLFKSFFHSDFAQEIAETEPEKNRLYKYWKEAGLEGTPKQFFAKFLRESPQILKDIRAGQSGFEEYDYSKSPLENTRVSRNNMLIHLIQERLMDEETFEARYTPGGFANASNAARVMRELIFGDLNGIVNTNGVDFNAIDERIANNGADPEPNYDPSDPLTILTYNQQNQVAGKLIGIFANQNTNHAFSSLMDEFRIADNFAFSLCGKSYTDLLHGPKGVNVDLNVAEFLSASVDAVKDPVLNFLNLNTLTADSGAILARLGYNTKEIGLLFNQPVIKKVCDYAFNNSVGLEEAIRQVSNDLKNSPTEKVPKADPDRDFSMNQLAKNIVKNRVMSANGEDIMSLEEYRVNQLKVLRLFSQIQKVASDVSQFVTTSKFTASNAVGSTFGDLYAQQMKVAKYISRFGKQSSKNKKDWMSVVMQVTDRISIPISNRLDSLDMSDQDYVESLIENPLAYEQAMYDMNRKANRLLNRYYPYETSVYKTMRNNLAALTKSGTLDADTINSAHSDLMVYMLTEQGGLFNGDFPCKNNIPAKDYYRNHFTQEVFNLLESEPDLKELPLFQYLQIQVDEVVNPTTRLKEEKYSMNVQDIGGLNPYQKEEIKDSWAELYKTHPEIARDLFMYNFYKLGFTFSPLSFMNLAPVELKKSIKVGDTGKNYVDFLREVQSGSISINQDNFARQYILNHLDNRRLTYTPKGDYLKLVKPLAKPQGVWARSFELDITEADEEDANAWTLSSAGLEEGELAFRPCLVIDGAIYMAQSGNKKGFNISDNGKITYIKMEALGSKNKSLQYNSSSTRAVSNSDNSDLFNYGGTNQEFDPEEQGCSFDRESFEKEIVDEMIKIQMKAGEVMSEEIDKAKAALFDALKQSTDDDVKETVESLRNAVREDGVIVLDENGNPKKAC